MPGKFNGGPASAPAFPKEGLDLPGAFVCENAFYDLDPVVVPWIVENLKQGADRAPLGISCTEDEGLDPGMQTRTRTHQTGFQGNEKLGTYESVIARNAGRLTEGHDFCMRGRIPPPEGVIVAPSEDLPLPDDNSTNRHLSQLLCLRSLQQGLLHGSLEHGFIRPILHAVSV